MHGYIKDRVYYKHEKEDQKLHMGNGSWTINMSDVEPHEVDEYVYITQTDTYRISKDKAINRGFIKPLGGEQKLVVPIRYWTLDKREKVEDGGQGELFNKTD